MIILHFQIGFQILNIPSEMKIVLPLTGQSESEGRHQLQLTSYQSPEHLEQVLSRPPDDGRTNIQKLVQADAMLVFIRSHQISTHCLQCKSHINTIHSLKRDGFPCLLWKTVTQNGGEKHQQFRRIFQQHSALGGDVNTIV